MNTVKHTVANGVVRIVVLAPVLAALPLPLCMLRHATWPVYIAALAGGFMVASGIHEIVLARRAELPEARIVE